MEARRWTGWLFWSSHRKLVSSVPRRDGWRVGARGMKQTRRQDDVKWRRQALNTLVSDREREGRKRSRTMDDPKLSPPLDKTLTRVLLVHPKPRVIFLVMVCNRHAPRVPRAPPFLGQATLGRIFRPYGPYRKAQRLLGELSPRVTFSPRGAPHRPPSAEHGYGGVWRGHAGV